MKKFAVVGIAAFLTAPVSLARDVWLERAQQINRNIVHEKDSGAKQLQLFTGNLKQGRIQTHPVRLEAGKQYIFFADCDRQCSNIDLALADGSGKIVAKDEDSDDSPVFSWQAKQSGQYTLTVSIPKCETSNGCDYSSQVFEGSPWLPRAQQINRDIVHNKDRNARQVRLITGQAGKDQPNSHQVQLSAGKYYTFFADCNYDCSDIDLSLKSSNGSVIKEDIEDDDAPMFGWQANRSGSYTLTVTMPKCESSTCEYSSQVFMGTKAVFH